VPLVPLRLIDAPRPWPARPRRRWFVDGTYAVKVADRWIYLCIGQWTRFGQVTDVLAAERRVLAATRRFFTRAQLIPVSGNDQLSVAVWQCWERENQDHHPFGPREAAVRANQDHR
jgi:hypothetical protein